MSILSDIFGAGDVVSKGIDLIDSMHTSTAEEIEVKTKAKVDLIQAYSPYKLAQRYIAFAFLANFILSFWAVVGLWAFSGDVDGFLAIVNKFWMGEIMATIVAFYYGGGFMESKNRIR